MKKKILELGMGVLLLVCFLALSKEAASVTSQAAGKVIVVDAGHGGADPGMVGIGDLEEKGINLAIAQELKELLEKDGYQVVMTREEDKGLYQEGSSNKKAQDMQNRCALIAKEKPAVSVSIHQNSLPSSKQTHGAQVFYGKKEGSAEVANAVQLALNQTVNAGNEKTEKAIDASIFLMKNVTAPAILIECGFLSNPQEEALLTDSVYQERVAWNIFMGIMQELKIQKE